MSQTYAPRPSRETTRSLWNKAVFVIQERRPILLLTSSLLLSHLRGPLSFAFSWLSPPLCNMLTMLQSDATPSSNKHQEGLLCAIVHFKAKSSRCLERFPVAPCKPHTEFQGVSKVHLVVGNVGKMNKVVKLCKVPFVSFLVGVQQL